jgi:hypothetical protein
MQQWSPFWRWLAVGVLAAMTIAWVAQSHSGGRETRAVPSHAAQRVQKGPGTIGASAACASGTGATVVVAGRDGKPSQQVCVNVPGAMVSVNGDGAVAINTGGATVNPDPQVTAALQRERGQLQQQEAQLQQQQAQLSARMAALQARLNSLGQ